MTVFQPQPKLQSGLKLSEEDVLESMEAGQSFRVISLDKPIQTNRSKSSNEKFSLIDNIGTEEKDDLVLQPRNAKTGP